uniref:F-box domain-containing protein n=1 Tax=Parastrongyloides trichosuri TaxID=131310 RepID=A0A0N4ZCZ7_PARTI
MSFLRYFSLIPTHLETYFAFKDSTNSNNVVNEGSNNSNGGIGRVGRIIRIGNPFTLRRENENPTNERLSFEEMEDDNECIIYGMRDDNEAGKMNDLGSRNDKDNLFHFGVKSCNEEKVCRNGKKRKNGRGKKRRRVKCRMTQSIQSSSSNYILHNRCVGSSEERSFKMTNKRGQLFNGNNRQYKDIVAVQDNNINGFYYNYILEDEIGDEMKKNSSVEKAILDNNSRFIKIPLKMQVTEFNGMKDRKVGCVPKKVKAKQREVSGMTSKVFDATARSPESLSGGEIILQDKIKNDFVGKNVCIENINMNNVQSYLITSMDGKGFDLRKKSEYMELKDEEENINDILPNEVLLRVFSYLDMKSLCQGAQVCKLWNNLAMNGANWMVVNFFDYQRDIKPSVVENISRRSGYYLRKLSLRGCQNIQDGALRIFAVNCRNIEVLSLSNCKRITDLTCEYLGKYCKNLKVLDFENCLDITDNGVIAIVNNCTMLEEINFNWNKNIQDKGITYLLSRCKNLKKLFLKGCNGLTENCFGMLPKDVFPLIHLNLMLTMATERTLNDISTRFINLEYLNISNCSTINDNGIMILSQSLRSLKTLEMAGGELLSDLSIQFVARFCKQIKKLDIEDCSSLTDNSLYYISKGLFNLEHLVLSHCEGITNNGIRILAEGCIYSLKELELDNLPEINDNVFEYLYEFKGLKKVCLFDCQNISKAAITKFEESRNYETSVQAYFAPPTPQVVDPPPARGICRCCTIL